MIVPVADGAASLHFTSDNKGRRSGFVASYVALASAACMSDADCMSSAGATACDAATGACVCAAGWAGLACDSPECLALNPWTSSSGNAIASNASSAALPRNANCVWALNATADTAAATGLRIVFSTFQLEADSPGDAIVITRTVDGKVLQTMASTAESATPVTSIRNFTCDGASGACSLELSGETAVMMALTTDVNDDGATLSGVGATWYAVSACSDVASGSLDCELNGGSCSNGGCFAADGSANDCTCNWDMMCLPGMYFDVLQHECMSCTAGTYASGTGVRVSCDECAAGKFAPSEDSESCGSCANGQIALSRKSTECVVCPAGATCSTATSLTVNPGMWRGSFTSFNIFDCPIRDACLGSNATTSLCAPGYGGIICAVCQPGFVKTSDGCVDCNTLSAPIVTIITVSTTVVIVLAGWYLTRTSKRFAAALEAIQFSVAFKIYFATCQVLGVHATLFSDVLFEPLKGFLVNLAAATDLADFFGCFGVACAHHELRSFRTRLLIATIVPIVLISGIVASFVFRALFSPPNHMRALQHAHSTFALLLLYVALPSTSSMILRAFLRDSRPLGTHGEQYLIADYEGAASLNLVRFS